MNIVCKFWDSYDVINILDKFIFLFFPAQMSKYKCKLREKLSSEVVKDADLACLKISRRTIYCSTSFICCAWKGTIPTRIFRIGFINCFQTLFCQVIDLKSACQRLWKKLVHLGVRKNIIFSQNLLISTS